MTSSTILIADDDRAIRTVLSQALGRLGHEVRSTGNAATLWRWVSDGDGDLIITDVVMPDENGLDLVPRIKKLRPELRIIVMSAQNTLLTAVKATERGAFEYLSKPFDLRDLVNVVQRALTAPAAASIPTENGESDEALPLIGRSPAMQEIYRVLARLMGTDLTVMITGESGTGKELVARALHDYGKRRNGPFVAINMAAIPRELIESELFGHEKGSFTGALARGFGRFEQAQGGTLFLDEIGDMPPEAQTRLLRVLQQGEYTTIGGRTPIRADVRILAATHRDLRQLIRQGLFREDLFYRLNVVPVRLPPLRERSEDIGALVRHFFALASAEGLPLKSLDNQAMERLKTLPLARECARTREPDPAARGALFAGGDRRRRYRGGADGEHGVRRQRRKPGQRGAERRRRTSFARLFRRPQRRFAADGPLRPRTARDRAAPHSTHARRDSRQPASGGAASRPQPEYAAEEDSRVGHRGRPRHKIIIIGRES